MNPTIQIIADELGISKTTVHRALSGTGRISDETKKRVLDLAEKLDYTPNTIARSLRSKRSMTIGLILRGMMVGHFYSEILAGIEEVAAEAGYVINIACSADNAQVESDIILNFCRRQVDGIIIAPVEDSNLSNYKLLRQHNIPFVFIDKYVENVPADVVTADSKTGVKKAVHTLLQNGRHRIAFLNGFERNSITIQERIAGYREQLSAEQNEFQMVIDSKYYGKEDTMCGYVAVLQTLQRMSPSDRIDALVCVNDSLAFGALKAIREFGLSVPQDIAVVGNNNDKMTEYVYPMLTTLSQPKREMGRMAMKLLLDRIRNSGAPADTDEYGFYSFPVSLLVRDST